jgi:hypothetical protein
MVASGLMKMLKKGQDPTEEEVKVPAMLVVAFC